MIDIEVVNAFLKAHRVLGEAYVVIDRHVQRVVCRQCLHMGDNMYYEENKGQCPHCKGELYFAWIVDRNDADHVLSQIRSIFAECK